MNLIYTGSYNKRFTALTKAISKEKPSSIVDLCFGDIRIAEYCKTHNIKWTGIDINSSFVDYAKGKGFDAKCEDILHSSALTKADMYIISGSMYHFTAEDTELLFNKVFSNTDKFLISEPVINLSSAKGVIGYLARRSANAGKGNEHFRYDEESFSRTMDALCIKFGIQWESIAFIKKDIIVLLTKNEHT